MVVLSPTLLLSRITRHSIKGGFGPLPLEVVMKKRILRFRDNPNIFFFWTANYARRTDRFFEDWWGDEPPPEEPPKAKRRGRRPKKVAVDDYKSETAVSVERSK